MTLAELGEHRLNKYLVFILFLSFLGWSLISVDFNIRSLVEGLPYIIDFLSCMVPPDAQAFPDLIVPAVETVQMAFLGTLFASILSIPLAVLAAKNITTSGPVQNISKGIIAFTRTVPDIVFALIFVSAVGLGPFPGVLAISLHSVGMLGKLYAEAIEEIDPHPVEALEAVGADKIQTINHAVLPQVLPSFISDTIYRFDINVREAVVLGMVGAGGIGFELIYSMRLFRYREVASILILTFILIIFSERISDALRKKIIGEEVLK
jgi:phosphonate transport system permease protein